MSSGELPFEAILEQMWRDARAGDLRDLDSYQSCCPGCSTEIESEYRAIQSWSASGTGRSRREERGATRSTLPGPTHLPPPPRGGAPPEAIGRYRVIEEMRGGGMGRLLLAEDPVLGRRVVLKTVNRKVGRSEHGFERLMVEARVGGRLHHPNLCPVLDLVEEEDLIFVVMPFVEGRTLAYSISEARARTEPVSSQFWVAVESPPDTEEEEAEPARRTPTPVGLVSTTVAGELPGLLRLMEAIARAVHAAHEAGVVHRDLKPSNIMLEPDGQPVIMDFGLALDLDPAAAARFTTDGSVLGTLPYMAPEQAAGNIRAIGPRTDVYALGAILYELLTLQRPIEESDSRLLLSRIIRGDIRRPRKLNPRIPPDLEAICLRALSSEPGHRYATALELAEDLERVRLLKPTAARPLSTVGRTWRLARRHPVLTFASSLILLLAIVLAVQQLTLRDRATELAAREAFDRWEAHAQTAQESPNPHEPAIRAYIRDELLFTRIQSALGTPTSRRLYAERLKKLYRGDDDAPLLTPRAGILDPRPSFRFRGWTTDPESVTYRLKVFDEETYTTLAAWILPGTDIDAEGLLRTELPEGTTLPTDPGRPLRYAWTVDVILGDMTLKTYGPTSFFLISPELRARTLAALTSTGDPTLDAELQALALLTLGLATEATPILDALPRPTTEPSRERRSWLRTLTDSLVAGKAEAARFLDELWAECLERTQER